VNFNTGYNLAVDSFNLQALSVSARTRISKIDVVYSSNWDWYAYDTLIGKRLNQLEYDASGRWLRPLNTSLALNTTLASGAKKKDQSKSKREANEELSKNPNAYIDFSVPWNLNAGLIFGQNQSAGTPVRNAIVNFSGDVSITEKWKVSFSSGYDFVQKEISFTSIDIYRDLHCWEMRFNWIPFGFRQSYNFSINVKSGMLQDLKLNRRRQWFDLENE
jgi:hypothetical protein